jgi:hypothetical protein
MRNPQAGDCILDVLHVFVYLRMFVVLCFDLVPKPVRVGIVQIKPVRLGAGRGEGPFTRAKRERWVELAAIQALNSGTFDTAMKGFGNIVHVVLNLVLQVRGLSKSVIQGESVCLLAMCTEIANPYS